MKFTSTLLSLFVMLQGISCAHQTLSAQKDVLLELKGAPGRKDQTRYYSHTRTEVIEDNQLLREKDEMVDFTVESVLTAGPADRVSFTSKTIRKDGTFDLHDLAFPEKGESIDFVLSKNATVLSVSDYPPSSVFYIPPIPLPDRPVRLGDTWEIRHLWASQDQGIPMELRVIGILKSVNKCPSGTCALIAISGDVQIAGRLDEAHQFHSELNGEMSFAVEQGLITWSLIQSDEQLKSADGKIHVTSCLMSKLDDPKQWSPLEISWPCRPFGL